MTPKGAKEINFEAIIHSLKVDAEGESTLILKVPLSELASSMIMLTKLQKVIQIKVLD